MSLQTGVSPLRFFIMVVSTSFGAGMLTMPRSTAEVAKEDMWLAVILAGLIFMFAFWSVTKLSQYFPEYTCIEYHRILLGPILGQAINIFLLLLIFVLTALSLRIFGIALVIILLGFTPPQIAVTVLLLLAVYATQYGLAPFMRIQQMVFMLSVFFLLPIILLGLISIDMDHFQPILAKGFTPVIKGVIPSWFAYTGPQLIIGLIYPFLTPRRYALKWGAMGIGVLMFMYTLLTMIIQGLLGAAETAHLTIPTITAYREVEIPDTFIERIDGYLMILWIPVYFTSLMNLFYFSSFSTARLLKLENSRPVAILLVPFIYYLINIPQDIQTVIAVNQYAIIADMIWSLAIVPVLLGIAWLKAKRRSVC